MPYTIQLSHGILWFRTKWSGEQTFIRLPYSCVLYRWRAVVCIFCWIYNDLSIFILFSVFLAVAVYDRMSADVDSILCLYDVTDAESFSVQVWFKITRCWRSTQISLICYIRILDEPLFTIRIYFRRCFCVYFPLERRYCGQLKECWPLRSDICLV